MPMPRLTAGLNKLKGLNFITGISLVATAAQAKYAKCASTQPTQCSIQVWELHILRLETNVATTTATSGSGNIVVLENGIVQGRALLGSQRNLIARTHRYLHVLT